MDKIRLGIRTHDLKASSFEELKGISSKIGIANFQFSPTKLPFVQTNGNKLGYGFTTYLDQQLSDLGLNIPILGCYVNIIDSDPEVRKSNLSLFENYLTAATFFKKSPIVATETGSVSGKGYTTKNYSDQVFEMVLESVAKLVQVAENLGVIMAIEPGVNHPVYNLKRTEQLLAKIDSPNLKLIFNPVNLLNNHNYTNQRQIINKFYDSFGQKIIAVHLKDFVFKTGNLQMAALGTGMFDQQYFLTETAKRYPYMYCLLESISREQVPAAINLISKWVEIEP